MIEIRQGMPRFPEKGMAWNAFCWAVVKISFAQSLAPKSSLEYALSVQQWRNARHCLSKMGDQGVLFMGLQEAALCLEGLALGDAFGQSLYPPEADSLIAQRQLPRGSWTWTDDTHMALSVFEELKERGWIDQDYLARRMAWRYTADPARGYGKGTRTVLGGIAQGEYFRPITHASQPDASYGSACAARAAVAGAFFASEPFHAVREAILAAGVTHAHPEALAGAQAVAAAAALASGPVIQVGKPYLENILTFLPESRVRDGLKFALEIPPTEYQQAFEHFAAKDDFVVFSVVPFALWCAAYHLENFEEALWWTVQGRGNRDNRCAIVGALAALAGRRLPEPWLARREPLPFNTGGNSGRFSFILPKIRSEMETQPALQPSDPVNQRILSDPVTGLPNMVDLLDWNIKEGELPKLGIPFSLIGIQLEPSALLDPTAENEQLFKFISAIQSKTQNPIYRIGRYFLCLVEHDRENLDLRVANIVTETQSLSGYSCKTMAIHFDRQVDASPARILTCLNSVMANTAYRSSGSKLLEISAQSILENTVGNWIAEDLANQFLQLARIANESIQLSETDSISQLPNMRAALRVIDREVDHARQRSEPLAVLMMDGDNLRRFNSIAIEAGDEAIRMMGITLKNQLRRGDFLARWRTGDEFLVLLPQTDREMAEHLAARLCKSIEQASQDWFFPTTISIGAVIYPYDGRIVDELLHAAEKNLESAKHNGKNQVVFSTPVISPNPLGGKPD